MVIIIRLIEKRNNKLDHVMQFHTQASNITTNPRVKIYLTLLELSATKHLTWNCHVNEHTKVIYYMILVRYINRIMIKYKIL